MRGQALAVATVETGHQGMRGESQRDEQGRFKVAIARVVKAARRRRLRRRT
jgi:hypothetical protein